MVDRFGLYWYSALLVVWILAPRANGAPVTGWLKDTSFGGGSTAVLTNAQTNAPILGNGTSNNADNTAIYAAIPLVALENGHQITLTARANLVGSTSTPDFRWGLFKDDGIGAVTGGWLGFIASAESVIWSKDPSGSNFATTTFASTANGRGAPFGQASEPENTPFFPGTYDMQMTVERFGNEADVRIAITSNAGDFEIVSQPFTEKNLSRLTFAFDRVGFLAGSSLDADQIQFSQIDVAAGDIQRPTLEVYSSGLVVISNATAESFALTQYEITSEAGSLNDADWTSLDSQENNDPIGSGWDEVESSGTEVLAEVNLLSSTSLASGGRLGLGHAFVEGAAPDLEFRFTAAGQIERGIVRYLQSGDYNQDGIVDVADYVAWRKSVGTTVPVGSGADGSGNGLIDAADYDVLRRNFEKSGFAAAVQANAVPEPGCWSHCAITFSILSSQIGRKWRYTR